EAAPLVVHEDEHAPLPLWRPREGDVYGLHEALTQPDVAARVVVGTERPADPGRDERDVWERSGACVLEELVDRSHEREHARSPTQGDGEVGEVLRRGHASAREVLEDRRRAVLPEVQGMQ